VIRNWEDVQIRREIKTVALCLKFVLPKQRVAVLLVRVAKAFAQIVVRSRLGTITFDATESPDDLNGFNF
jgi:hypothetical protein